MGQAWPLLDPAALRCGANPDVPATLLVVGACIVVDHCCGVAIGKARTRVLQPDHDHRRAAFGWRSPSTEGIVTADYRTRKTVPLQRTRLPVVAGESHSACLLIGWQRVEHCAYGSGVIGPTNSFQLARIEGGIQRC